MLLQTGHDAFQVRRVCRDTVVEVGISEDKVDQLAFRTE
jgi:hypothetical protein